MSRNFQAPPYGAADSPSLPPGKAAAPAPGPKMAPQAMPQAPAMRGMGFVRPGVVRR